MDCPSLFFGFLDIQQSLTVNSHPQPLFTLTLFYAHRHDRHFRVLMQKGREERQLAAPAVSKTLKSNPKGSTGKLRRRLKKRS